MKLKDILGFLPIDEHVVIKKREEDGDATYQIHNEFMDVFRFENDSMYIEYKNNDVEMMRTSAYNGGTSFLEIILDRDT